MSDRVFRTNNAYSIKAWCSHMCVYRGRAGSTRTKQPRGASRLRTPQARRQLALVASQVATLVATEATGGREALRRRWLRPLVRRSNQGPSFPPRAGRRWRALLARRCVRVRVVSIRVGRRGRRVTRPIRFAAASSATIGAPHATVGDGSAAARVSTAGAPTLRGTPCAAIVQAAAMTVATQFIARTRASEDRRAPETTHPPHAPNGYTAASVEQTIRQTFRALSDRQPV
jgi:hypothetical protein